MTQAKKSITVRAISKKPNSRHQSKGIDFKFNAMGFFETTDPKEIAELKKYDHRFWDIIDTKKEERQLKMNEAIAEAKAKAEAEVIANFSKKDETSEHPPAGPTRAELIAKATEFGYKDKMKQPPNKAKNDALAAFIEVEEANANSS